MKRRLLLSALSVLGIGSMAYPADRNDYVPKEPPAGCLSLTATFSQPTHHPQEPMSFGPFQRIEIKNVPNHFPLTVVGIIDGATETVIGAVHEKAVGGVDWVADNNYWGQFAISCDEEPAGR